ncbi:hypothetical protein RHS01_02239 [Rhizoctonia solani]|uniref:Uncharacterized protein n=1 Tax=Rhizoctonia solani TaxID=456999 RepID=A0A8H7IKW6_9AGAM|nr:hypothetical protein RHS01_02239 [Rhizoctonia solani]
MDPSDGARGAAEGARVNVCGEGGRAEERMLRGIRSLASRKKRRANPDVGAHPKKRRPRILWALCKLPNPQSILMFVLPLSANPLHPIPAGREQRV